MNAGTEPDIRRVIAGVLGFLLLFGAETALGHGRRMCKNSFSRIDFFVEAWYNCPWVIMYDRLPFLFVVFGQYSHKTDREKVFVLNT